MELYACGSRAPRGLLAFEAVALQDPPTSTMSTVGHTRDGTDEACWLPIRRLMLRPTRDVVISAKSLELGRGDRRVDSSAAFSHPRFRSKIGHARGMPPEQASRSKRMNWLRLDPRRNLSFGSTNRWRNRAQFLDEPPGISLFSRTFSTRTSEPYRHPDWEKLNRITVW